MLIDNATVSPVSNTRSVVTINKYNTSRKNDSLTLIPKVTVTKIPFTHKVILAQWGLYLYRDTK
jgi:hypothetical protein